MYANMEKAYIDLYTDYW